MSERPSRAKMCNWLSSQLLNIHVLPSNPADIRSLAANAKEADRKIRRLGFIAAELGWHADADLDEGWALIQEFDAQAGSDDTRKAGDE